MGNIPEEVLLALAVKNSGGGGGGGTSNYNDLNNKPQIGGTTLTGDKSASDLGLVAAETGKGLSTNDFTDAYKTAIGDNTTAISGIKDGQTIDSFGDVESALADKVDKVNGKGLSTNDYTDADKAIVGGVTAALAGKQNALTAGNNIKIDDDTISVNRWFIPAGKMVYTIITSDENYGQNVHVQRHTLDGVFVDDRTFLCEMYKTVNIDGLISIWNPYAEFRITLLKDSDEQQAGYMYVVNPITSSTSTSFTFMMEQEENDNDLIIREELDAVSSAVSAIKDGTSIDSFADVETALAGKQATLTFDSAPTDGSTNPVESNGVYDALANKQNATDNNLQTTDKTVVGAVNEVKSGLTNVDVALSVPENAGRNVIPLSLETIKSINTGGTWAGNVYTFQGVSFTVNTDASGNVTSIVVDGTATASSTRLYLAPSGVYDIGGYILNGAPTNDEKYVLRVEKMASPYTRYAQCTGSDAVILDSVAGENVHIFMQVKNGETAQNVTFYPMIRPATITDTTFAPYIPSVESRIEAVESGVASVTSDLSSLKDVTTYSTDADLISAFRGVHNYYRVIVMRDSTKTMALLNTLNEEYVYAILIENQGVWSNHPNFIAFVTDNVYAGVLNIGGSSVSVTAYAKLAKDS